MIEEPVVLLAGTIKRIHVDQARIRANLTNGTDIPPLTIQAAGGPYKAHEVEIRGPSKVVFDGNVLSCGARVWIESRAEIATIVRESLEPCCDKEDA